MFSGSLARLLVDFGLRLLLLRLNDNKQYVFGHFPPRLANQGHGVFKMPLVVSKCPKLFSGIIENPKP